MTSSRYAHINRRRLVASTVVGGATIMTARQVAQAGSDVTDIVLPLAQDGSGDASMSRTSSARTEELSSRNPDASNGLETIWRYTGFGTDERPFGTPHLVDGVIYIGGYAYQYPGTINAVNADDGIHLWQFTTMDGGFTSSVVVDDVVYVGSNGSALYAVNTVDGTERWKFTTMDESINASIVVDEVLYSGSDGGVLYAVNTVDGTERWQFVASPDGEVSPREVVDEVVFAGDYDGILYALNADDGTERWRSIIIDDGINFTVVVDGVIYAGCDDGNLYALNADDGTERWRFAASEGDFEGPLVIADGVVYTGGYGDVLYAVNATDGTERWRFTIATTDGWIFPTSVVDGIVYIGSSYPGILYAVNATDGTERWRFEATQDGGVYPWEVVDGVIYAGSYRPGNLFALSVENGTELWRFTKDDEIYPFAVDGGVVYALSDAALYAIGARVPKLSIGGTARVTEKTHLRGGPASTTVERAELKKDTIVMITGEAVQTGDVTWWPVMVNETGAQGWVEASRLEPLTSG